MFKLIYLIGIILLNSNYLLNKNKTENISRRAALVKGKFYVEKCVNGELMNNNTNFKTDQPKISVIIPVYNCEKTIKAAVRSIQNQDMAEIEIILVNDFSNDTSSNIINELSQEDSRIKVINNDKNMGALYSRNLGILNSKSKYIMNLDNDDLFFDKDVFDIVYNESESGNYDILGFSAIDSPNYKPLISQMYEDYFHRHKDGLIIKQPELAYFPISKNNEYKPNDFHVWARLVKTNLYIKAINNLGVNAIGEQRNTTFLSWAEDSIMSMVLFHFAESYKFIGKYGLYHFISKKTASFTRHKDEKMFSEIFFLDIVFDFTGNKFEEKKYVIGKAKEIRYEEYYSLKSERNVLFFKAVFKKIMNCEYISEKNKNYLKSLFKELEL